MLLLYHSVTKNHLLVILGPSGKLLEHSKELQFFKIHVTVFSVMKELFSFFY